MRAFLDKPNAKEQESLGQSHSSAQNTGGRALEPPGGNRLLPQILASPPPSGFEGQWLGKPVGSATVETTTYSAFVEVPMPGLTTSSTAMLIANRTLGAYDTEAAAIAAVKINGTQGAVTLEDGLYVAYQVEQPFTYQSSSVFNYPAPVNRWAPVAEPGVVALISSELIVCRPEPYGPAGPTPQPTDASQHLRSTEDPFQGYKDVLGSHMAHVAADPVVKKAFQAALKDTALLVLNKAEAEISNKKERFGRGLGGVGPDELETIRRVAGQLTKKDGEIHEAKLAVYYEAVGLPRSPLKMNLEDWVEFAKRRMTLALTGNPKLGRLLDQLHALEAQRRIIVAEYPLLSRIDPAKLEKLTDTQMVAQLGGKLPGILDAIAETRQNIADDKLDLWTIDLLVDATMAGLDLSKSQREIIRAEAARRKESAFLSNLVLSIFTVGLGIAAMVTTGGLSLVLTAGAAGLGVYDAAKTTEEYLVNQPASNTNENKDEGFVVSPSLGWLVVAWAGVVLDTVDVVRVVKTIGTSKKSIVQGAEALATEDTARRLGTTRSALLKRLKAVAGVAEPGEVFGEAHRAIFAKRFGIPIHIDPKTSGDVRVLYDLRKGTGRVRVTSVEVHSGATVAEVLAHENVVRMMRRYEGVTGNIRQIWDRLQSFAGKTPDVNPFPPGSLAWESWYELKKFPELVDAQILKYKNGLTKADEATLAKELEILEQDLIVHQSAVDEVLLEKGVGYVAKGSERTRAERTAAILSSFSTEKRQKFNALEKLAKEADGSKVVPLVGIVKTNTNLKTLVGKYGPADFAESLRMFVFEALVQKGAAKGKEAATASKLVNALLEHEIVVIKGTGELRAFGYRAAYLQKTGQATEDVGVLHHFIPLYLGGEHKMLLDMPPELHRQLHELIDNVKLDKTTTLAPNSIQKANLNFEQGAAILHPDGSITFDPLK